MKSQSVFYWDETKIVFLKNPKNVILQIHQYPMFHSRSIFKIKACKSEKIIGFFPLNENQLCFHMVVGCPQKNQFSAKNTKSAWKIGY